MLVGQRSRGNCQGQIGCSPWTGQRPNESLLEAKEPLRTDATVDYTGSSIGDEAVHNYI